MSHMQSPGPKIRFNRKWLWTVVLTVLVLGAAAYAILPMVLVLAGSLESDPAKVFSYWDPLSFRAFVPPGLSGASYSSIIQGSFGTAMLNSIIVATATVVIGLVMSILAAFSLAVLRFRFREAVFAVVVVSFLIPFDAVSIPDWPTGSLCSCSGSFSWAYRRS
jgi:ABC-type glycerol-3-phosphate transport system permease component